MVTWAQLGDSRFSCSNCSPHIWGGRPLEEPHLSDPVTPTIPRPCKTAGLKHMPISMFPGVP